MRKRLSTDKIIPGEIWLQLTDINNAKTKHAKITSTYAKNCFNRLSRTADLYRNSDDVITAYSILSTMKATVI